MRALTAIRAAAWVGVAVAGWSLNLVWGTESAAGKGPPGQWERAVVGAALLCGIAAVILSVAGRKGAPPGWIARGLAAVCSAGALAVALFLRSDAAASGFEHLVLGPGWKWLTAGASISLAAAAGAALLRPSGKVSRKKSRGRRRARAR